ncbi:MAG: hypothetical protein Q9157_007413 [Trypethelium eluteriae]
MGAPIAALSVVLWFAVIVAWKWAQRLWIARENELKITENHCQPVKTLYRNPIYLGLDVVYEMFQTYYSGTRNRQLQKQFQDLGETFRMQPSGTARIFTIDPLNVKAAFGGQIDCWGVEPLRLEAFRPLVGAGVLVTDGARWTHARGPSQSYIDQIYRFHKEDLSTFDDHIELLLGLIPADGSTVDLKPIFNRYMADSGTAHILGRSIGALQSGPAGDEGLRFMKAALHGIDMSGKRDELPQWTQLVLNHEFRKSCRIVHEVVDRTVNQALEHLRDPAISKQESANLAIEWAKLIQDPLEIRNQVLNMLIANLDTIPITLTNVFFHLARNPKCYEKLRREVMQYEGDLTGDSLRSLHYLQAVINETMRLNTAGSFNARIALKDNVLPRGGGPDGTAPVFVPQGDIVICSVYALQRRPEVFGEDADSFTPERWNHIKPKTWEYMPFSAGPRVCPGQKLARIQVAYVLFSLVRRFKAVENRDPVLEYVEEYRVATASKNGAKVALHWE